MGRKARLFWGPWAAVMSFSVLLIALGFCLPVLGHAQAPPTTQPATDAGWLLATLGSAMHGSNWRLALAATLALVVLVLRHVANGIREWLSPPAQQSRLGRVLGWCATDRGGAVLVLLSGTLTSICVAGAAGKMTWQTLINGAYASIMAAQTVSWLQG